MTALAQTTPLLTLGLALALTLAAAAVAYAALRARSLVVLTVGFVSACALAAGALAAEGKSAGAVAVALVGVGLAPFGLLGTLLLSTRAVKPKRGWPWLTIGAGAALGAALLWAAPGLSQPLPIAAGAGGLNPGIVFIIAPLVLVGAVNCVALIGYGERGALDRGLDRTGRAP